MCTFIWGTNTLFSSETNTIIRFLSNFPSKSTVFNYLGDALVVGREIPSLISLPKCFSHLTVFTNETSFNVYNCLSAGIFASCFHGNKQTNKTLQTLCWIKQESFLVFHSPYSCCMCNVGQLEISLYVLIVLIHYPGWMGNLMLQWQKEKRVLRV